MIGVDITLNVKTQTDTDPFGAPVYTVTQKTVSDVLVGEPSTDDVNNVLSLYGKKVVYTLAIPKGDEHNWEDTEVILPEPFAGTYHTIAPPRPASRQIFRCGGIRRCILSESQVKVKLNRAGVRNILQSQMMMDAVTNVATAQGEIETSFVGFDRVQVIVKKEEGAESAD